MERFIYTAKLLLLTLLVVACSKEAEDVLSSSKEGYIILSASSSSMTQTRVGFDDKDDIGVDVLWQRDAGHTDKFSIYNGAGNYVGDFVYIGTHNEKTGQFIQTSEFAMADGTYTAVYPAVDGASYPTLESRDNALYDLDVTTQTQNGGIAHLNESVRMRGQFTYSATATSPITFTFTQELVMATVSFVAPSGKTPNKLILRDGDYISTLNISSTTSGSYKAYFLMRPNSGSRYLYFELTNTNGTVNRHVVATSTLYEAAHRYQATIETFNEWIPIYDKDDLASVNSNLDGDYILINDIDIENDSEWKCIGDGGSSVYFTGVFNGNGKEISNMTLNTGNLDVGFFKYCRDAEVYDLTLSNFTITSSNWSIGALAGVILRSKISNVTINNSNISGSYRIGGAIGLVQSGGMSYINNLTVNTTTVESQYFLAGGAIGGCAAGVVINNLEVNSPNVTSTTNSYRVGGAIGNLLGSSEVNNAVVTNPNVQGNIALGGFCGRVEGNSKLSNIRVENPIVSAVGYNNAWNVGGAIGELVDGEIEGVEVISPTVIAEHQAGGVVGELRSSTAKNIYVEMPNVVTYESSVVEDDSIKGGAGGVIGRIANSDGVVTVEDISCKAPIVKGKNRIGGAVGVFFDIDNTDDANYILRNITVDFPEVEGTIDVGGAIGLAQLNSLNTNININISNITVNAPKSYGQNSVAGVAGAIIDWGLNNTTRMFVSDLTATNVTVEATGHYVSGLIGYIEDVELKNSKCIGGEVNTDDEIVGGVVGVSVFSKIVGCYNSADVSTRSNSAGGILGHAENNSQIIGCYNSGTITSPMGSGGIIGGRGSIATVAMIACYNTGNIMGNTSNSGALLGRNESTSAPTITSCNWVDMPLDNATRAIGNSSNPSVSPISYAILNSKATVDAMNAAIAATGESVSYVIGAKSPELE